MITLRSNPYEYQRRLPHYQKHGRALFVTFRKFTREPFPPAACDLVLDRCLRGNGRTICLHAAVIMPDHAHLLLTPMPDKNGWPFPLKHILKLIKGASAHDVNQLLATQGPVWQDESFDHVLRCNESFEEKKEYIRQNPVRKSVVEVPEDYPWLWLGP